MLPNLIFFSFFLSGGEGILAVFFFFSFFFFRIFVVVSKPPTTAPLHLSLLLLFCLSFSPLLTMSASKNIFVFENNDALSTDIAKYVAEKSAKAIEERGKFTVAFSGGSLPNLVGRL